MTERTTLLMKLYAISLVTVLLILQAVSFHLLRDREGMYDSLQVQKGYRAVVDQTYRSEDLGCIARVNADGTSTVVYEGEALGLCRQSSVQQATQRVLQRYLNGDSVAAIKETTAEALLPALSGTLNWLLSEKQRHLEAGMDESAHRQQILQDLKKGRNRIRRVRGIIERLPGADLRAEFQKAAETLKSDPFLAPRLKAALTGPMISSKIEAHCLLFSRSPYRPVIEATVLIDRLPHMRILSTENTSPTTFLRASSSIRWIFVMRPTGGS